MLEYDLRLEYELNHTEREIVEYNDSYIDDDAFFDEEYDDET